MKYCPSCGLRYPDKVERCRACSGQLAPISEYLRTQESSAVATSGCPNPDCSVIVAHASANFCELCGTQLKSISYDLWLDKFVRPALENGPADLMFDPSKVFQAAAEMGLSRTEARNRFDGVLKEVIGIGGDGFNGWIQETRDLFEERSKSNEWVTAEQEALNNAKKLNIKPFYAAAIVESLAHRVFGDRFTSTSPPTVNAPASRISQSSTDSSVEDNYDPVRRSAISFYTNISSGGDVSSNLTYLNAEKKMSAHAALIDEDIFLREVAHKGTFVLFRDNSHGWVFPNPRLVFRPKAFRPLFPFLTKEEFNDSKCSIKPVRVISAGPGRWQVTNSENGKGHLHESKETPPETVPPETERIIVTFPISAADFLNDAQSSASIVRRDVGHDIIVCGPGGRGELALLDQTDSFGNKQCIVIPRITSFRSAETYFNLYREYYECSRPSRGDVWIIEPAIVHKVQGGWRVTRKGVLEVRQSADPGIILPIHHKGETGGKVEANNPVIGTTIKPPSENKQHTEVRTDPIIPCFETPIDLGIEAEPSTRAKTDATGPAVETASNRTANLRAIVLVVGLVAATLLIWRIFWVPGSVTKAESVVDVAAGNFQMGNNAGEENERPQHDVTVKPLSIDKYEVTREEYEKFVNATAHKPPSGWTNGHYLSNTGRWPVTGVDWYDANAYCKWLGKRLPTEEEWEFAARGADGRKYPWGDEWKAGLANAENASQSLTDVDRFTGASPFGAIGMVGNAWEWTASKLLAYPGGRIPPQEIGDGKVDLRVIRGGSWQSDRSSATTTYRWGWPASGGKDYSNTGFRCVKDAQ